MPEPALDTETLRAYAERLGDKSKDISELDVRSIMRHIDTMIGHDHLFDAWIFDVRALCYLRLNKPARAADQLRLALQRVKDPEMRSILLCNQSAAYLDMGRPKEAAEVAVEAARVPHPYRAATLGNLAQALVLLGERPTAFDVVAESADETDFTNPAEIFLLARTAANVGADADAVEFFARYVAVHEHIERGDRTAIDIITSSGHEAQAAALRSPALLRAIRTAVAFATELTRPKLAEPIVDDDVANKEADEVFEATRGLRSAAAGLVL
jgi:tetratricopeptide (TPR) repeat protein